MTTQTTLESASGIQFQPRRSQERGNSDHGWLKTFHSFAFADYYDPRFEKWGSLRVINEDRVSPKEGFGTHSHREFEIFSYIVQGELEHRDSMGNVEIMKRGDVQLTSAGTGIRHSEKTHGSDPVHFLQIWSVPSKRSLPPAYYHRHFSEEDKKNKLCLVVAPVDSENSGVLVEREGKGPTPVYSPLYLYATLLEKGKEVEHTLGVNPTATTPGARKGYIHVVQTSGYNPGPANGNKVRVTSSDSSVELLEGDGLFVTGNIGNTIKIENVGEDGAGFAEVLLFDLD